jgi:hypothetical protein
MPGLDPGSHDEAPQLSELKMLIFVATQHVIAGSSPAMTC